MFAKAENNQLNKRYTAPSISFDVVEGKTSFFVPGELI